MVLNDLGVDEDVKGVVDKVVDNDDLVVVEVLEIPVERVFHAVVNLEDVAYVPLWCLAGFDPFMGGAVQRNPKPYAKSVLNLPAACTRDGALFENRARAPKRGARQALPSNRIIG